MTRELHSCNDSRCLFLRQEGKDRLAQRRAVGRIGTACTRTDADATINRLDLIDVHDSRLVKDTKMYSLADSQGELAEMWMNSRPQVNLFDSPAAHVVELEAQAVTAGWSALNEPCAL